MPTQLSHFGEDIVHAMVCELGQKFLALCPGFETNKVANDVALTEVRLDRYAGLGFDGASRIDMLLLLEGDLGLPFEIKLGSTRLSRTRIDEEWLRGCGRSHRGKRWNGNMLSILERKFPDVPVDKPLHALIPGPAGARQVVVTRQWCIVARQRVIDSWKQPEARPSFSDNVRFIGFESIVKLYEGDSAPTGQRFNAMIRNLLHFDFYDRWINGGEE